MSSEAVVPRFLDQFGDSLSSEQRRVLDDLARCRTAALGGHVEACDQCGHQRIAYNSCRNRHCPKCQGTAAAQWLDARAAELLPVEYFHVVFTLPGSDRPHRSAKSAGGLRNSLPSRRGDLVANRRRSQAPRCRDRHLGRPAHVGTESTASSPRPLCRPRWRIVSGRLALDRLPSGVLPARAHPEPRLSRQVPGAAPKRVRSGTTVVPRQAERVGRPASSSSVGSPPALEPIGSCTPSRRSAAPRKC